MKLMRYGITLRRITIDDIEMVRKARNAVRQYMDYKEYITPEMQLKWFKSIDNPNNFYYIVEYQDESIGLINEKNASTTIGKIPKDSEGGIFIFNPKNYNSHIMVLASFILIEKGFYLFGDKHSIIHVMKDNQKAINYNRGIGYVLCEGQENYEKQKYILTRENFEKKTSKLRKAALKLAGEKNTIMSAFSKEDYESGLGDILEKINIESGIDYKVGYNQSGEKTFTTNFDDLPNGCGL